MFDRRTLLAALGAGIGGALTPYRLMASAAGTYLIPIALESGRLLVSCKVNGQGPLAFAIDTGGVVSLIRRDLVKQLSLNSAGSAGLGVAGRTDRFPMFEAREVVFGNQLRQAGVVFAATDFVGFGEGVSGSLAAGCLTTIDSELDFQAAKWRLYPGGGPRRDGWVRHERAIEQRSPIGGSAYLFADASLGTTRFRCALDTGAPTAIRLFPELARKSGLYDERQNWSPSRKRDGQIARIIRARIPLSLGDLILDRPLVALQMDGPRNRVFEQALVGLPLIRLLDVATEVKARQLWTRANGLQAIERYNMSGLWIDQRGKDLIAGSVGRGSPADQAGIAIGDRIQGVDFQQLIKGLNGPAGGEISFGVARGGQRRDVTLTLANYL